MSEETPQPEILENELDSLAAQSKGGPSRGVLWVLTVLLVGSALYLFFGYLPKGQSEVAKKGIEGDGQVRMKDIRVGPDGKAANIVYFTFKDASDRNHSGESVVDDQGLYDSLKTDTYIKVRYLPNDPTKAVMKGAEGMVAPHSEAIGFLAWTLMIGGLVVGFFAFRAPKQRKVVARSGPNVTITRR
jgi:hypothetical protein